MPSKREPGLALSAPPSGAKAGLLRRLGVDRLWARDPARAWRLARLGGMPVVMWLAPRSAVYGAERIPESGGVLIAANHFTALDPAVVAAPARRAVHFFAKAQLFRRSILRELLLWVGAIPVGSTADNRAALRHARELLRAGSVVAIFVEGARQRTGEVGPAMPGAALLAVREGVPVVPCGLDTYGWSKRTRRPCTVVFGEPLQLEGIADGREGVEAATERVSEAVEGAWRTAVAAREAGHPASLADGARREGWRDCWMHALLNRSRA